METRNAEALGRLVEPRWGAAAAYLVALALSQAEWIQHFPALPILGAAAITVATNALLPRVPSARQTPGLTMSLLLFDAAVLTGALYLTGGASNPLSALYLVPVALAAVALPARYAWALVGGTVLAFGLLFLAPPLEAEHALPGGVQADAYGHAHHVHVAEGASDGRAETGAWSVFDLHLRGMWVAFALTAISVAYFVTRIARSLAARDEQLALERARAMRAERVASLAGLAASTAHELGTPIASIKLAASEMRRALARGGDPQALLADVDLVDDQARRCREILDAMLADTGETVGEAPVPIEGVELGEAAMASLPAADRARVRMQVDGTLPALCLPRRTMAQAIHNLLRNALDASSRDTEVVLRVAHHRERVSFEVEDRGVGMSEEQLAEAMEPFSSTKAEIGHGLGLFLARTVAIRLGGDLTLRSEREHGTVARLEVAANAMDGENG